MNEYMTLSVVSASVVYYILLMLIAVAVFGMRHYFGRLVKSCHRRR